MRLLPKSFNIVLAIMIFIINVLNIAPFILGEYELESSAYSDFIDAYDNKRYDVKTLVKFRESTDSQIFYDTINFTEEYTYYLNGHYQQTHFMNVDERIVTHTVMGDEYYRRLRSSNLESEDNLDQVPFLKFNEPGIYEEILDFFNDPIFSLTDYWDGEDTNFRINLDSLSEVHLLYIEKTIKSYLPELELPENGYITYYLTQVNGVLTTILIRYGGLFAEISNFDQTIFITEGSSDDISGLVDEAYDLSEISTLVGSELPSMVLGEDLDFEYGQESIYGQIEFIEIEESGVYIFSTTDDNDDFRPYWHLFDLELNKLNYDLEIENESFYDPTSSSVYLTPGIYMLYLEPRAINMDQASLLYSLPSVEDDYSNCYRPEDEMITSDSEIEFSINYVFDVDAFTVQSDADYVVINYTDDFSVGISEHLDLEISYIHGYQKCIIKLPENGIITFYLASAFVGNYIVSVEFHSFADQTPTFGNAEEIDIYNQSVQEENYGYLVWAWDNKNVKLRFDISEHSIILIQCNFASITVYNSEINVKNPYTETDDQYVLLPGTYYLEVTNFTGVFAMLNIIPEPTSGEVRMLQPIDSVYRVIGYVNSFEDADVFQFTLEKDSTIQFNQGFRRSVLVYGADNPRIYIFSPLNDMPYLIPAGTYYLTVPISLTSYPESYVYDFSFTIRDYIVESDEALTYDDVVCEDGVTTYKYYPSFDYFTDEEKITLDVEAGDIVNFTYNEAITNATMIYTTEFGEQTIYIGQYNTNKYPDSYYIFDEDGQIVITFEVVISIDARNLTFGETLVEIHVWEEE